MSFTESPILAAGSPKLESATYQASCHCGRFEYSVTHSPPLTDPRSEVIDCNCSICTRNGYLIIHVPEAKFKLEKGSEDEFTTYTFGPKHKVAHYFCPSCGTSCFCKSLDPGFFANMKAVNVRMFKDVEFKSLHLKFMDGKSY
ncbi:Mss4-like protein [Dendryphion nanum]|uniref:Mss4-like protein n=1 Tax=Dendryphion nanum TaxID=256645 RepID=A0A9P9IKE5_9PLEO|nr:Mss4-like protein [Dendryphion nanum]